MIFRAALFASLLALVGCLGPVKTLYPPRANDQDEIFVSNNHWHTGIIVEFAKLPPSLQQKLTAFRGCRYIAIGWGDVDFFRAPRVTAGLVARALFLSRGSVLLVFGFDGPPQEEFASSVIIHRLPVSHEGFARMMNKIEATFRTHGDELIDAGIGENDGRFYFGHGSYSLFHTCNQWNADVLRSGGLPITAAYDGFASVLEFQLNQRAVIKADHSVRR